ncbi:DoxX family membrane protein [Streptomyces sp. HUCO-GS316]|uniref:DoxX family protein n=1 Tax=Streptomyces sp. HUCO-GS316 TaxID=2692198 RepID=UPI00136CF1AB|nr:DoxX family protein [Streptomyces sp. HUCO-GS316]MXM67663.1 DoxX family membrane protein [Streptomyces sp. HUCO-GS316]
MDTSRLTAHQPLTLGLFRIVIGFLFACQGAASVFGLLGRKATETGEWPYWYAAVIEVVCGVLIMVGIGTRAAAFLSSGAMAFAYFTVHQKDGLFPLQNGGESPALYCWSFLLLVFTGPGALSLGEAFRARRDGAGAPSPETAASSV